MCSVTRRVVRFSRPRQVDVVEESVRAPDAHEVRVRTLLSAVSPGTERLIYRGEVPSNLSADASIDALEGELSYPITYGYAAVGRVEDIGARVDDEWQGRRVFAFRPHVSRFVASPEELIPIPASTRTIDAVMLPNLETAVNLIMDGRPLIGERLVVFGQGVVGLLTTALAARHPVGELLTVDPLPDRRAASTEWGADQAFDPSDTLDEIRKALGIRGAEATEATGADYQGADLVFELSGVPSVLNDALAVAGFDARIIVGSWYGEKDAAVDLGGRFHRSRLQIKSSQVSSVDPDYRGRWTKERRMETVCDLLSSVRPGDLVTDEYPQGAAPEAYERLAQEDEPPLQPVFRYD